MAATGSIAEGRVQARRSDRLRLPVRRRLPAARRRPDVLDTAALTVLAALTLLLALRRNPGFPPFGSDNDEYRMLARSLWRSGTPVVAGVEGTKYPLGYSAVIGLLDRVGLPMTVTAVALNAFLVFAVAVVCWRVSRRFGRLAAATAGLTVVLAASLWDSVFVVMPDVALTAVVAAAFAWLLRDNGRGIVVALTLLGFAAAALKTAGLVLAAAVGVAMLARPGLRRWCWAPPAAGLGVTAAMTLWVRQYPPSSTGYGATFWLRDPGDSSLGRIGVGGLPGRMVRQLHLVLAEAGHAFLGPTAPEVAAIVVPLVLLAVAFAALPRWRVGLLTFWVLYTAVMAAWPYRSVRFGLPLVPLVAVGAGAAVGRLAQAGRRPLLAAAAAVAVAGLSLHAVTAVADVRTAAASEHEQLGALYAAVGELRPWVRAHVPRTDRIVSLDYRELAYRLDRPVLPLRYTRDTAELWRESGGRHARWLMAIRGLYARRAGLAQALVSAYPQRFRLVYSNPRVDVYRIQP